MLAKKEDLGTVYLGKQGEVGIGWTRKANEGICKGGGEEKLYTYK